MTARTVVDWVAVGRQAHRHGEHSAPALNARVAAALVGLPVGDPEATRIMAEFARGWHDANAATLRPEWVVAALAAHEFQARVRDGRVEAWTDCALLHDHEAAGHKPGEWETVPATVTGLRGWLGY